MKVKDKREKVGLIVNIPKTKIMASGPITSWQRDGKIVKKERLYFEGGGSQITADDDFSHEIKRHLLLGRKFMTNLDSILKTETLLCHQRFIFVKAMVFPVVLYGCES